MTETTPAAVTGTSSTTIYPVRDDTGLTHRHHYAGQTLTHAHPGGHVPHGYYGHPEDSEAYEPADAAPPVAAALDRDAVAAVLRKQLGTADFQAREVAGQICALMGGGGKEERPPRVTVDLNVRVRKHETYSAFDDVTGIDPASLRWGDRLIAVEVESSIAADAIVTGVDAERELVYLVPDWQGWTEDA